MRRPISHSRHRPPLLIAVLVIGLSALPAAAQQATQNSDDASQSRQNTPRTSRTDRTPAADAPRAPRPDMTTDVPSNAPRKPLPDVPRSPSPEPTQPPRPKPPTPPVDPTAKPPPDTTRRPQPATPPQSRPSLIRPRPDVSAQPRPDAPDQPRPDLGRTRPDRSRPHSDESARIRRDIARPDQLQGPELEVPAIAPQPAMVQINTLAIIATNADNRIDPALQDLANQLRPTFKFSGYRLAQSNASSVAPGQGANLQLIGAYSLLVTPTEADPDHVVLSVQAVHGSRRLLSLQLRLRPGTYQLLGGWPVSGGTLLAAVSASVGG